MSFPKLLVAEEQDEAFAKSLPGVTDLASLRAVSAADLLKAAWTKGDDVPRFGPDIDGDFLEQSVPATFAQGKQAKVPLLAGWNKDEGTAEIVGAPQPPTEESFRTLAAKEFGPAAPAFLSAYAASNDEDIVRVAEDYSGDHFIAFGTWAWIEAQVKTGGVPVYRYRFDRGSPGDPNHAVSSGAFHSDEIEYVFGNLDSRKGAVWTPEDYALSKVMQAYWTNFARSGDPNKGGEASGTKAGVALPQWPLYDSRGQWMVMHLDATPVAKPDVHRDRYLFLQNAWAAR